MDQETLGSTIARLRSGYILSRDDVEGLCAHIADLETSIRDLAASPDARMIQVVRDVANTAAVAQDRLNRIDAGLERAASALLQIAQAQDKEAERRLVEERNRSFWTERIWDLLKNILNSRVVQVIAAFLTAYLAARLGFPVPTTPTP